MHALIAPVLALAANSVAAPPTHDDEPAHVAGAPQAVVAKGAHANAPTQLDEPTMWELRPLAIELHLGIAIPTGPIGVTFDYSFAPSFSLGCGIGTNFVGPEGECTARFRWVKDREHSLYLGIGVSGGPHVQTDVGQYGAFAFFMAPLTQLREDAPPAPREWAFAKWLNVEVGADDRKASGFVAHPYFGLAFLLNRADGRNPEAGSSEWGSHSVEGATTLAYIGLGLGAALGSDR